MVLSKLGGVSWKIAIICTFCAILPSTNTPLVLSAEQEAIRRIELELFDLYAPSDTTTTKIYPVEQTLQSHAKGYAENIIPWTFIVYIAADNDLRNFSIRNIKQMASVGSNENINIFVHIDIRISSTQKITRRYFIEKNKIVCVNEFDESTQRMNSGDPKTLVSCCKQAIEHYPASHYALVLWNHGTGPIDPFNSRIINPSELFIFNPTTCKLELDRSIGFLDLMCQQEQTHHRGVCWDDSTGQYLTNQKLESALDEISTNLLCGKKLDILAFDACLMANFEVACLVKKYAHIIVGSVEVELGTGWNYEEALMPFGYKAPSPHEFAIHLVKAYKKTYASLTSDYTQSAINLDLLDLLENNVNTVAQILTTALTSKQKHNSVKNAIKASRHKHLCTHFHEPDYLDLHHLYQNLQDNFKQVVFSDISTNSSIKEMLNQALDEGKSLIKRIVFANEAGSNLSKTHGLSIYFPERTIHPSYPPAAFLKNGWVSFLKTYIHS